jgi:hypothetical protein
MRGEAVSRSTSGASAATRCSRSCTRRESRRRSAICSIASRICAGCERLGQVVGGAAPDRLDGGVDGRERRDHDDLETGIGDQQPRQQIEPAVVAEPQVEKRGVEALRLDCGQRLDSGARAAHAAAEPFEAHGDGVPDVALVVDDQDVERELSRLRFAARHSRKLARTSEPRHDPDRRPRSVVARSARQSDSRQRPR